MANLSPYNALKFSSKPGKRLQVPEWSSSGRLCVSRISNPLPSLQKGFCHYKLSQNITIGDTLKYDKDNIPRYSSDRQKQISELGWKTNFHSKFKLVKRIGAGEFGTVYAAEPINMLCNRVAVKILSKTRKGFSHQETLQKLRNEVEAWKACQGHENVVTLFDTYEDEEYIYLVQELCSGGNLSDWVKDETLSELTCARVMHSVLSILQECHAHQIVFGDVKPANFLLTQKFGNVDGSDSDFRDLSKCIKASDFGCSIRIGDSNFGARPRPSCAPPCNRRQGTPVYMAPEAWASSINVNADIWAAGIMMYQLLSGRFPFWPCHRGQLDPAMPTWQVMLAVCSSPICFTAPEWKQVSLEAKSLLLALLDRDIHERITAAKALKHPWFIKTLGPKEAESAINIVTPCHHSHY
mmetsp:Transcript_11453/g.20680  ORF Transcript_11453/g.20680 Transcript_11453/m.20680 type:complete len:410 (-) Transcript_11453:741-1970(-)|eukprot:CAMPEP_0175075010 /NCGR_PEP_ID=MMETSP0052_2-20121109/21703_1 /TAXON_ID=51329 ORGANISM="Polytomella parva, Strain SAG 63-3" /NCGR_SAMPLE_ID=MMETSP0052_2 /ASSEMBLY_ACC=CAM_ASM_000194 /LENGTH=409 /DNA_ID=CAMNT_0016343529 /DNA_START=79 /DNA_END=1308 /DNA_ORIENTATION=+